MKVDCAALQPDLASFPSTTGRFAIAMVANRQTWGSETFNCPQYLQIGFVFVFKVSTGGPAEVQGHRSMKKLL